MTKGEKKLNTYFRELLANEKFLNEISEYQELDNVTPEKVTDFIIFKRNDSMMSICMQYSLDYNDFFLLMNFLKSNSPGKSFDEYFSDNIKLNVCSIIDKKEFMLPELEDRPLFEDLEQRAYDYAYPLSINVRSLASLNDLKEYIDKNGELIEYLLSWHRNKKKTDIRNRDKVQIADITWKHRDLPTKQIKEFIIKEFPEDDTSYFEITKIKSDEIKRRRKDLSIT